MPNANEELNKLKYLYLSINTINGNAENKAIMIENNVVVEAK
ncbi:hypothetical protein PCA01_39370 [Pseudoalteromonas carrageenovora]|nr:hypothetical protein PCA01_39370 [Pseudoalteromonas carrageenovora]